ncbi:hypothetical protein PO909_011170 [Leuciscus waleckii]
MDSVSGSSSSAALAGSSSAALEDKQESKMKMCRAEYRSLSRFIEHLRPTRQCMNTLKIQFPHLPPSTLLSIFSQEYQKRMKRSFVRHHAPDTVKGYYQRYRSEAQTRPTDPVLLELANQVDLSPALLARVILECFLQECEPSVPASRLVLNNMLREPHLIPDLLLAKHVEQCTVNDCCYGPLVDCIKHAIGLEHEDILRDKLRERNLSFLDENQLRAKGYDKTPDIILEFYILNSDAGAECFGGSEVDSSPTRNLFALQIFKMTVKSDFSAAYSSDLIQTQQSVEEHDYKSERCGGNEEQNLVYGTIQSTGSSSEGQRFGPGLVIYWYGFISDLDCERERGILLKDGFPSDIVTLCHGPTPCGAGSHSAFLQSERTGTHLP